MKLLVFSTLLLLSLSHAFSLSLDSSTTLRQRVTKQCGRCNKRACKRELRAEKRVCATLRSRTKRAKCKSRAKRNLKRCRLTLALASSECPEICASQTPTPSASASVSASTSATPSATPSTTSSATPSTSPSASPSESPEFPSLGFGEACDGNPIPCADGLVCGCDGLCTRNVEITFEGVADDGLSFFTCGSQVGSNHGGFFTVGVRTYSGPCSDIFVLLFNTGTGPTSFSMKVTVDGSTVYGTNPIDGFPVVPLLGTFIFTPPTDWNLNNPGFDYSSWADAENIVVGDVDGFAMLKDDGVDAISPGAGTQDEGQYGFRFQVPYCDPDYVPPVPEAGS